MKCHRNRLGKRSLGRLQIVGKNTALPRRDGGEFRITAADEAHLCAPGGLAPPAAVAMAAAAHRCHRDPVARLEVGHAAAAAHHFPGKFMAEYIILLEAEGLGILGHVQVGAADAASGDPEQDLVVHRLRYRAFAYYQRQSDTIENYGFHVRFPISFRRVGNHGASTTLQISPQMPPRAKSAMKRVIRPSTTR